MFRLIFTFGCFLAIGSVSPAAVVVVANMTEKPIAFSIGEPAQSVTLAAGDSKPFTTGRTCPITAEIEGQSKTIKLDAWSVYVFTKTKGVISFTGVELAGKTIPLTDVPEQPAAIEPITVKVKLYVDDANPFVQSVWEPKIRKRLATAQETISQSIPVKFEVVGVGTWKSDPEAKTTTDLLTDFEEKEKFEKDILKIGISSRLRISANETAPTSLMKQFAPLRPHLLIRDGLPKSESEQGEFLAHELCRYFGAVTSPDPNCVMRNKLGDGRALLKSFEVRVDPLNMLAMNLWASEWRGGKLKTWQELKPNTAARLARVYETLAKADPAEKQADAIGALIASQIPVEVAAEPVRPMNAGNMANPVAAPPMKGGYTREQAIRRILRGMTIRATDLQAKPEAERLKGDGFTVELIKTAADIALSEEEAMQVPAFAIAIGIGLDDSTIIRNNPLTKALCESVESADEFKARGDVIKTASLNNRRDLCQHFSVSCALTELVGPELARQAGLAKELQDMKGTSGFSFADLIVDYAGVEFVERLKADKHLLRRIRQGFRVADYVPKIDGLPEGLNSAEFAAKYGSVTDPKFRDTTAELRERVKKLGGYAK